MEKYRLTPTKTLCPVCSCTSAHILYSVDSEMAALHFIGDVKRKEFMRLKQSVERLWQDRRCDFVRCTNCSFCYAQPYREADSEFYEAAYDRPMYASWKWDYQVTYETLSKMVDDESLKDFTLLEIGAGDGAFVKRLAPSMTSKHNVACTEYSAYGRGEITGYGIECLAEDVRKIDRVEWENYFDVVCMFQVLEHIAHPDALFERISRLAKTGAHLFIAVPNAYQREFYDLNGVIEDLPPVHVGRWNRECFDIMAQRYGWDVVRYELEPESVIPRIKRFIVSRSQENLWLSQRIAGIRMRCLRGAARRITWLLYLLASLHGIVPLAASRNLGVSQWIHLKKRKIDT